MTTRHAQPKHSRQPLTAWKELCQKSVGALFSTLLATDHERQQAIATKMVQLAPTLDESRKRPWLELATALGR